MDCFIKKIWQGKGEESHYQFVRFSKGRFKNRAVLDLQKSSKIKLRGSFEWANDFVNFVSELGGVRFSGIIFSKQEIDRELKGHDDGIMCDFDKSKKKELFVYVVEDMDSKMILKIKDKIYVMLLDAESPDINLKIKKRLLKPGRGADAKVDDKFCQLEASLKFWPQVKEAFMLLECRKCKISHIFEINEIIMPEGEKDFVKMRETAKRKGKIIRKIEVDKQERKEEKEFVA